MKEETETLPAKMCTHGRLFSTILAFAYCVNEASGVDGPKLNIKVGGTEFGTALKYFIPYALRGSHGLHVDVSVTYIVVTGVLTASRAEILYETWGHHVSSPHRLTFIADEGMGEHSDIYGYRFLKSPASMLSLHYSRSDSPRGRSVPDHQRSQLKWLDAILHLGKELATSSTVNRSTDWYMFLDDDTFLIPDALTVLLSEYNSSDRLLIGKGGKECHKLCGGAGFAISKALLIRLYLKQESLTGAFFHGYVSGSGLFDADVIKHHSDVVLSNFILTNKEEMGSFVRRQEFKNFSPLIASKWVIKQLGYGGTAAAVSFHRLGGLEQYYQAYLYFRNITDSRKRADTVLK